MRKLSEGDWIDSAVLRLRDVKLSRSLGAVSEAPPHSVSTPTSSLGGASDTALRLVDTNPANFLEAGFS